MNWHGPHQVAQKSTKTGLLPPTVSSKFFSESSIRFGLLLAAAMLGTFLSSLICNANCSISYLKFYGCKGIPIRPVISHFYTSGLNCRQHNPNVSPTSMERLQTAGVNPAAKASLEKRGDSHEAYAAYLTYSK
jgi:hypothetical protein